MRLADNKKQRKHETVRCFYVSAAVSESDGVRLADKVFAQQAKCEPGGQSVRLADSKQYSGNTKLFVVSTILRPFLKAMV